MGDETVNSALQSKLDRGKNWLRKNSIKDYAEKVVQQFAVPLATHIQDEHFITDITTRDVSVHPFEIGSRGYISTSNIANIKKLN